VAFTVGGAVVLLLAVAAAFLLGQSTSTEQAVTPPPTVVTTAPVVVAPPVTVVPEAQVPVTTGTGPDGCLGGPDPYTAILPAQAAAALDVNGAAAFARTAFRYLVKAYPQPTDYDTVLPQVFVDHTAALAAAAKPPTKPAPEGTTIAYIRSNETSYQATMTGDNADVTVNLFIQLDYPDGNVSQVVMTQRFLLTIQDGRWRIVDTPPTESLPPAGTGGSLYFVGAC
jgi:hypothetical protein